MPLKSIALGLLLVSFATLSWAQTSFRGIFVISSEPNTPLEYSHLREVDIAKQTIVNDIYDAQKNYAGIGLNSDTLKTPLGGPVASLAYDQRSNRIFYFPMFASELRFIDLDRKGPRFTALSLQSLNLLRHRNDVANQVTRMTIGADGYGYALTNDAEHLIRFSTQGTPTIEDLGMLTDEAANSVFVKSSCTSWGGDMVADKNGDLILITQNNFVFRINIQKRQARYLGQIQGLPAGFTTNGAAIDEIGGLLLSSGSSRTLLLQQHLFRVNDMNELKAEAVNTNSIPAFGNISDMASSFLLSENSHSSVEEKSLLKSNPIVEKNLSKSPSFTVFPNPVSSSTFSLRIQNIAEFGDYTVLVSDIAGRRVMERPISIQAKSSTHTFRLPSLSTKGTYVVMLVDYFKRTVFSSQIIAE